MAVQAEAQAERAEQEVFSFQAEAVQILDLMVHSLYSNKEYARWTAGPADGGRRSS